MPVYVIGDVHGRLDALQRLLSKLSFNSCADQIWLVGDLVNRGPQSVETIEYVRSLGNAAVTVIGNHDLFFLAYAEGILPARDTDTFPESLRHPAAPRALDWLRRRPLIAVSGRRDTILVHAGLPHVWRLPYLAARAAVIAHALSGPRKSFLKALSLVRRSGMMGLPHYRRPPWYWLGSEDMAYCLNALVHIRRISLEGVFPVGSATMDAMPADHAKQLAPWFETWTQQNRPAINSVFFGHWASLGGLQHPPFFGLDTNCGRAELLTAMNATSRERYSVGCC